MNNRSIPAALIVALGMIISAAILSVAFHHSPPPPEARAPAGANHQQTLLAADEPLALGDIVEINVSDVIGQGVVSTKYCRIGKDGTVRLWYINEVPAAGKGTGQLEEAVIKAFQDKQIIAHAVVTATAWRG